MSSDNLVSLIDETTTIKVSSTLEKANGRKNIIDGNPETCWTSQQGLPQFIQLTFDENVTLKRISLTFQGGFVGTRCAVCIPTSEESGRKDWEVITMLYPEDVNRKQVFDVQPVEDISALKLVFEESSDFFGRITIYDLRIDGTKESSTQFSRLVELRNMLE